MEKHILKLFSILIIGLGIFLVSKPGSMMEKLKSFYSRYPIIRYAGEKQLTSRPQFIVVAGIIVIIIGMICFFTAL